MTLPVYVREGFLSIEECEASRTLLPGRPPNAAVNTSSYEARSQPKVRRGRATFIRHESLSARIAEAVRSVNERFYRFETSGNEPLQLAEYAVGDFYDWHLDIGPGKAALRKLSASVQLSAPDEYDGGELEIWGSGKTDRAQGTLIVFPSYLLHRVVPVTRGVRRSLVAWFFGATPYR